MPERKHAQLVESAKRDPRRIYNNPSDVLRDRRLTDDDRIAILKSWEREAQQIANAANDPGPDRDSLEDLRAAREEAERRLPQPGR